MPLGLYGYKNVRERTVLARHRALRRALRAGESQLALFRRLNQLMVFFKNKDPGLSKIFKADRDWVRSL